MCNSNSKTLQRAREVFCDHVHIILYEYTLMQCLPPKYTSNENTQYMYMHRMMECIYFLYINQF